MDSFLDYIIDFCYSIRRRGIYPVSNNWDAKLQEIIEEGVIIENEYGTVIYQHKNKMYQIRTSCWPYAYGTLHSVTGLENPDDWVYIKTDLLPKARTAFKLREVINKDKVEKVESLL